MKQDKTRSFNMDCLEFMQSVPDKFYDLAIVDPPYGINITNQSGFGTFKKSVNKNWDSTIPSDLYFFELKRISKNQIIWGGNYFIDNLKNTNCCLIWDKMNGTNDLSDFELAWTSFNSPNRKFSMHHFSSGYDKKIHPTQKPVKLYEWLLMNYAKEGDKILDTHGGSQSSRIACYNLGFELDIIELDKDYFEAGNKRFDQHKKQLTLF